MTDGWTLYPPSAADKQDVGFQLPFFLFQKKSIFFILIKVELISGSSAEFHSFFVRRERFFLLAAHLSMGRTEEIGLTLDQIGSDVLFSAGGWRAATDWSIFEIFRDADLLFCLQLNFFNFFKETFF